MKTLAELKKAIKVGTKIMKVDCCNERFKPETIGKVRVVDKVQTNAFTMDGSWMWWSKASDYEITENTFSVYYKDSEHTHDNLIGTYKIMGV